MNTLGQDLRYAFRAALANPVFTAMVVLTLALGIGANTALFSVVDAVLLRPLPYPGSERLVRVYETFPLAGGTSGTGSVSVPNLEDWRAQARSFAELAPYSFQSVNLQGGDTPERLASLAASANWFALFGERPLLGRGFSQGDDRPGARAVVVLSEGLWRRRFGADPKILERTVVLDGVPHAVAGVMGADFQYPPGRAIDVWVPLLPPEDVRSSRGSHAYDVLGLLRPGIAVESAQAEMEAIAAGLAARYPDQQAGRSAQVIPLRETLVSNVRRTLVMLLGATGIVLLIACANAANLLLARAMARRREVAVRTAMGAGRGRLVALHLAESLLLAVPAALLGLGFAWAGVRGLLALSAGMVPRATEVRIDERVALFLVLVTVATGIVFGLAPAFQSLRTNLNDDLREGGQQAGAGRFGAIFRSSLVVGQIALSLVLLVGAGLLLRTLNVLLGTATGMATEGVVTLNVSVPPERYPDDDAGARFFTPVRERIEALPGVLAAGWTSHLPLRNWGLNGNFAIEGRPPAEQPGEAPFAEFRVISPGTLAALGVPVVAGRDLSPRDTRGTEPVAVVNRTLAELYFPGESPVGKRLRLGGEPITIVGVAGDVRQSGLDALPRAEIALPDAQVGTLPEMTLAVRTAMPPERILPAVRAVIRAADPGQPVYDVRTLEEVVTSSLASRRLNLVLFGSFAALALLLALAGIYGVLAYTVGQRRREIGIRMALGARVGSVLGLFLGHGARLTLAGLALGLAASLAFTRLMGSLLYGVSPTEPAILAAVCVALAVVALLACYLPARRAMEVEPAIVLRAE